MDGKPFNAGAQDPELKNSPVAWDSEEETEALREEGPGGPVCFFNDEAYDHDTVIKSGTVLLRCDRGIWFPAGSSDPDNP